MRRKVITICPSYNGNGLKYNKKLISIESLPEYIEKLLERWQWHYDRMIDDEDTVINAQKVTQFGERLAIELQEYLPEFKITALSEDKIRMQINSDLEILVKYYKRAQNYCEVIKLCQKRVSLDNSNIQYLKDLAIAKFNAEHYFDALSDIEALGSEIGENDFFLMLTGHCHFRMQNFKEAESIFNTLLKKSPEDKSYLLAAAENYMCFYEYEKAIDLFVRAIKNEPEDDDIKVRLANAYHLTEQFSEEIKLLKGLLKVYPNQITLLELLSSSYYSSGQYYSSIEILKQILSLAPEEGDCYYNLALNYHLLKMDNLAVDNYFKAILKNPQFTIPFWKNGNFLLKLDLEAGLLKDIISFGAEYGDELARKYLDSHSLKK